ncbi:MAG: DUF2141 domain-containing protein [Leptospiraceae bacterium]|nr:DUF2141 domain-containing protein [Leptospiraceae bacterium]
MHVRKILILAISLFFLGTALADTVPTRPRLFVHVTGLRNSDGFAGALLFRPGAGFPDQKALAFRMAGSRIDANQALIVFADVPSGDYALSVLHDENENRKMDKNLISMPKEGFGFSNNPQTGLRVPDFEESRFSFPGDTDKHIYIRIRYL